MKDLITSLVGPATSLPADTEAGLAGVHDWGAFCAIVHRAGCAPLVYERLRTYGRAVPPDVLDWLHAYRDATAETNNRLLNALRAVTVQLAAQRVPALVLKGPILAFLGTGLQVRLFHDLDLLVQPGDLARTAEILRSMEFVELQTGDHDYHRVFARTSASSATVVEVHFGMLDRERGYVPDLEGLWNRATSVGIIDHTVQTVSVTDHLLLTILQLPHHHWNFRLVVDIGHVAVRCAQAIDWAGFMDRSRGWGMRVLAASTLHAAASMWHLALPPEVARFAQPDNYIQRVQWHLVQEALSEQLSLDAPTLGRTAQFLILDRPSAALAAAIRRSLMHRERSKSLPGIVRRLRTGAVSMPALFTILSGTALNRRQRGLIE